MSKNSNAATSFVAEKNEVNNRLLYQSDKKEKEPNPVSFTVNGKVMVNATEMAKPFGDLKRPTYWLKNQSTIEFLDELSVVRNLTTVDLIQVKQGGYAQGTWMHEDVALEFARWLSPKFAIWCNDRIKELVKGRSAIVQFTATMEERISRLEKRFDDSAQRLELYERQKTDKDMELVIVNFQLPRYLRKELNVYCQLNHTSVRQIMVDYLNNELLKSKELID